MSCLQFAVGPVLEGGGKARRSSGDAANWRGREGKTRAPLRRSSDSRLGSGRRSSPPICRLAQVSGRGHALSVPGRENHAASVRHPDGLHVHEFADAVDAELAAVAGSLHAAERHARIGHHHAR